MERLITKQQQVAMLKNGLKTRKGHSGNHRPVVKLFTPDAGCTWLLSELDPEEPDLAFGLCDLGLGFPELGYVSLSELAQVRGAFGLPVERDLHFKPTKTLMAYAEDAHQAGRITA